MERSFYTQKPLNKELQSYIAYYYFHDADEKAETERFTYFPHIKNALTIYKDSSLSLKDSITTESSPAKTGYTFFYTNLINHFARAQMNPPFSKIGVVFQPLGLNHFLPDQLSNTISQTFNFDIRPFNEGFNEALNKVYATSVIAEKVALLDAFFMKAFIGFTDDKMKTAMALMLKDDADYSVQSLAVEMGLHRKTLLRMFKKHLNCSVRDYLRVIKFRRAVDFYQSSVKDTSFTHLAYEMNYNDQSEFTHHFKKLTGFSPKVFFKNVESFSDQGTFWSKPQ